RVVVALVRILGVVAGVRRTVGYVLLRVDRPDRTDIGLVTRGTRRALGGVHVEQAVAEVADRFRIRRMGVLDDAAAGLVLGEQPVVGRIELVDALHRADVHARAVLHIDASLGDDRDARHHSTVPERLLPAGDKTHATRHRFAS